MDDVVRVAESAIRLSTIFSVEDVVDVFVEDMTRLLATNNKQGYQPFERIRQIYQSFNNIFSFITNQPIVVMAYQPNKNLPN